MNLDRITQSPDTMDGKPCIRSLPITVGAVVRQVAAGRAAVQILEEFPGLEAADIQQALQFAAQLTDDLAPADDDLDVLVDSVAAARTETTKSGGLSLGEHRQHNAGRMAKLSAR